MKLPIQLLAAGSALLSASFVSAASIPRSALAATANSQPDGTMFNIDGVTKYYAGTNSYWLGFLTNDSDVDLVMSHLQSSNLKILRVWGFNDVNAIPQSGTVYYQALVPGSDPVINTGADGLQRLDAVVASAAKHGIKLIINFVNNWTDYGGMSAYLNYYSSTTGNTDSNNPSWYNNTAAQTQYRKYIQAVVSRYANSSAIFSWELANEPRCSGCDTTVIYNWASSTSAYIKSLDSTHMVTLGDEGFGLPGDGSYPYQYSEGLDFVKNLGISTLDFGTFHMYPESWGESNDWAVPWIQAHGSACVNASKPCLLEEYGTSSDHCAVESVWQAAANSTKGIAADLFWQLGDTISSGQTANDGNTIYYGTDEWTCLVTNHIGASS